MGNLGGAARVDDVDLRRDLEVRAQPRRRRELDDLVAVVLDERVGVAQRELLEGVPDPVVGTRLGVVITRRLSGRVLVVDDRLEDIGHPIDDGRVGKRAREHDEPGSVGHRYGKLGLDAAPAGRCGDLGPEPIAVVHEDVVDDVGGVWVVAHVGGHLDDRAQVVE